MVATFLSRYCVLGVCSIRMCCFVCGCMHVFSITANFLSLIISGTVSVEYFMAID